MHVFVPDSLLKVIVEHYTFSRLILHFYFNYSKKIYNAHLTDMLVFLPSLFDVYMVTSVWIKHAGSEEMNEIITDVCKMY